GTASLKMTAATITGANAPNFSLMAPTSGTPCDFTGVTTVPGSGGSCNFGIKFTPDVPTGQVTRFATFNLTDNAADSPQTVSIIGLVSGPVAVLTPNPINFGTIPVSSTSATMNATLISAGSTAVNVSNFTITGVNATDFKIVAAAPSANPACAATPFALNP